MAFCATCGAQVEGRFCAKCGSPVAAGAPAAAGGAPPPPPGQIPVSAPMADNVACAVTYIFPINIVFLLIAPYNRNPLVRFHAFQSIFLDVVCVVVWIALGIVIGVVAGVAGLAGAWSLFSLYWILRLAFFLLWLVLVIQTYQGKTMVLPIIGPIAQQQARV